MLEQSEMFFHSSILSFEITRRHTRIFSVLFLVSDVTIQYGHGEYSGAVGLNDAQIFGSDIM